MNEARDAAETPAHAARDADALAPNAARGAAAVSAPLHVESVGAGPPLVLLHGFAMHGGLFAPILPRLARAHRVHVVDLPGHGHSPAPATFDLPALANRVADVLATLDEPCALVGWSLGGLVALELAARVPASVASLVLVATSPAFVRRPDWPHAMEGATLARFGDELAVAWALTLKRFLTLQVQGSDAGRATLAVLRRELFARGEPDRATLAAALRLLATADLRAVVPAIAAPTTVIAGGRDTLAPVGAGAWLAGALPRGRLAAIDAAAHAPFLSHPDAFHAALEAHFETRFDARRDAR